MIRDRAKVSSGLDTVKWASISSDSWGGEFKYDNKECSKCGDITECADIGLTFKTYMCGRCYKAFYTQG